MTISSRRKWFYLFALLTAFACAGSWAASRFRSMKDRAEVARLTETMKTICVGRYLVDVPQEAEVSLSGESVAGFEIDTVEEDEATFQARIAAREAEIGTRQSLAGQPGGIVDARDIHIPGMMGRTLIFGRNRGYLMEGDRRVEDAFVSVETHAHMPGLSFVLSAKYADAARANLAEGLLQRLRLRKENEMPSEPGFAFRTQSLSNLSR